MEQLSLFDSEPNRPTRPPKLTMGKDAFIQWKSRIFNHQERVKSEQPLQQTTLFDAGRKNDTGDFSRLPHVGGEFLLVVNPPNPQTCQPISGVKLASPVSFSPHQLPAGEGTGNGQRATVVFLSKDLIGCPFVSFPHHRV